MNIEEVKEFILLFVIAGMIDKSYANNERVLYNLHMYVNIIPFLRNNNTKSFIPGYVLVTPSSFKEEYLKYKNNRASFLERVLTWQNNNEYNYNLNEFFKLLDRDLSIVETEKIK